MRKTKQFVFTVLFILIFINNVNSGRETTAYWSSTDIDCIAQHGIRHANATFVSNATIILDGKDTEKEWNYANVSEVLIPTATSNDSTSFFKAYVYVKFVYDEKYLYIRAIWNDTTLQNRQDAIAFCFNINCANYSVGMFISPDLMKTMGENERVDNFLWTYGGLPNNTAYKAIDQAFGSNGWYKKDIETQDVDSSYSYGTSLNGTSNYLVELKRRLITNDTYDVQFNKNGTYGFAIAVLNDMGGEDHAVSFNWDLTFTNIVNITVVPTEKIDGFPSIIIIGLCTFTIICSSVIIRKRKAEN